MNAVLLTHQCKTSGYNLQLNNYLAYAYCTQPQTFAKICACSLYSLLSARVSHHSDSFADTTLGVHVIGGAEGIGGADGIGAADAVGASGTNTYGTYCVACCC